MPRGEACTLPAVLPPRVRFVPLLELSDLTIHLHTDEAEVALVRELSFTVESGETLCVALLNIAGDELRLIVDPDARALRALERLRSRMRSEPAAARAAVVDTAARRPGP